jgi:hypothetical protein
MAYDNVLRKLARTTTWQVVYCRAKEVGTIKLFHNVDDFSKIQIDFLQWLEIYYSLYMDISLGEKYINDEMLSDDIRVDAYLFYRRKKKQDQKFAEREREQDKKSRDIRLGMIPSVVFKRKP